MIESGVRLVGEKRIGMPFPAREGCSGGRKFACLSGLLPAILAGVAVAAWTGPAHAQFDRGARPYAYEESRYDAEVVADDPADMLPVPPGDGGGEGEGDGGGNGAMPQAPESPVSAAPAAVPYGPPDSSRPQIDPGKRYDTFGRRVGAVKWELAGFLVALTAVNLPKDLDHGTGFHFHDEGFFGKNTSNLGVDKLTHAFNSYLYSDLFYYRMKRKSGGNFRTALAASLLGIGVQLYGEIFDGFEKDSGWSMQDVTFNFIGAGFSLLRNGTPGLSGKLDFRILVTPNRRFYTFMGKEHYRQQRFLLAVKLAGFRPLRNTPLRLAELQIGYSARGFTAQERALGQTPQRRPFVGIGLNVGELFFRSTRSPVGRAAKTVLEYVQLPYTAAYRHW